jgi:hypothetical protein
LLPLCCCWIAASASEDQMAIEAAKAGGEPAK